MENIASSLIADDIQSLVLKCTIRYRITSYQWENGFSSIRVTHTMYEESESRVNVSANQETWNVRLEINPSRHVPVSPLLLSQSLQMLMWLYLLSRTLYLGSAVGHEPWMNCDFCPFRASRWQWLTEKVGQKHRYAQLTLEATLPTFVISSHFIDLQRWHQMPKSIRLSRGRVEDEANLCKISASLLIWRLAFTLRRVWQFSSHFM